MTHPPPYQTPLDAILATWTLGHGLGDDATHRACTISALNLALTGVLTDTRPDCVSPVIHAFVIPLQDTMPVERLNTPAWRQVVHHIAGTYPASAAVEQARLTVIIDWMWARLASIRDTLPAPVLVAWDRMLTERTPAAAWNAADAAQDAAWATQGAAQDAAGAAQDAARSAQDAAGAAAGAAAWAAGAAAWAAVAAGAAVGAAYWDAANPEALILQLCRVPEPDAT